MAKRLDKKNDGQEQGGQKLLDKEDLFEKIVEEALGHQFGDNKSLKTFLRKKVMAKRLKSVIEVQANAFISPDHLAAYLSKLLVKTFGTPAAPHSQEAAADRVAPPAKIRIILRAILPDEEWEITDGDLTEKFDKDVKMFGHRGAEWLYFKRVGKSAWPYLRRWLLKLGVFAWLADLVRRIAG